MREIRTYGLMSADGKRDGLTVSTRAYPRLYLRSQRLADLCHRQLTERPRRDRLARVTVKPAVNYLTVLIGYTEDRGKPSHTPVH
jgi:hypothetical protein